LPPTVEVGSGTATSSPVVVSSGIDGGSPVSKDKGLVVFFEFIYFKHHIWFCKIFPL
jgi:hypothetical protein